MVKESKFLSSNKKRTLSSRTWLERQLSDQYVKKANQMGYRSRAAFKLIEINQAHNILKQGNKVIDLGCAPGSWSQIAVDIVGKGNIVGVDLLSVNEIDGCLLLQMDFTDYDTKELLKSKFLDGVDVILSDMSVSLSGHRSLDNLKNMALCEQVFEFADDVLKQGGTVLIKIFRGGEEQKFIQSIKNKFEKVIYIKPEASRKDSSEIYALATGYKSKN